MTSRTRARLLTAAILVAWLLPSAPSATGAEPPSAAADEVLVRYRADTSRADRAKVADEHGLTAVRTSRDGRTQVVVAKGRSPATARRELKGDPRVLAVADNHRRELYDEITDEPWFDLEWGLHNTGATINGKKGTADVDIDGLEALRVEQGSPDVVVAVVDDGVDFSHVDLTGQAWTNPGETGIDDLGADKQTNHEDDDGNGYTDDVHGWDFCNDDNTVSDPNEDYHGTHVAGTIAASLNGTGVVGVAPGIKIMALKFIDGSSVCGADDMATAAIDYAASFHVPIINASWGGPDFSAVIEASIEASGALFVAAAGNGDSTGGLDLDAGGEIAYPASSTLPNVLTVAAVDQTGHLASFSNYGKTSVDISAPGTNILSSVPDQPATPADPEPCAPCWAWLGGTSMAAPHVSGVAALALSAMSGTPTAVQLRTRVLGTGTPLAATVGKTVTGRLANALRAIDVTGPVATPINRHSINVGTIVGSSVSTTMTWPAATDSLSGVKSYMIRRSVNGGAWTTLISATTVRSYKRTMGLGTPTRFQLYARDGAGNLGPGAIGPTVTARLLQDGTSVAKYSGKWSTVALSSASNGKLHRASTSGASVTFTTSARAIAIVGRRGPLNGKAKVYVDGVYKSTIDLRKSSTQYKVVVYGASWTSSATHSVKLVVIGGTGRVEVDAFVFLR